MTVNEAEREERRIIEILEKQADRFEHDSASK